jgi:hypothetical protein
MNVFKHGQWERQISARSHTAIGRSIWVLMKSGAHAAQQQSETIGNEQQNRAQNEKGSAVMPILAGRCDSLQNALNGPGQTPTLPVNSTETPISASGGAECGALSSKPDPGTNQEQLDPQLEQLLRSWDILPKHIKLSILALVTSSIQGGQS